MRIGTMFGLGVVTMVLAAESAGAETDRQAKLAQRSAMQRAKEYYSDSAEVRWPALFRTSATCDGAEDCAAKWEVAQLWVTRHAGYGIKVVTSVLIQTEGIGKLDDDKLAIRVTKQPDARGLQHIVVEFFCQIDKKSGCPDPLRLTDEFNATIKGSG